MSVPVCAPTLRFGGSPSTSYGLACSPYLVSFGSHRVGVVTRRELSGNAEWNTSAGRGDRGVAVAATNSSSSSRMSPRRDLSQPAVVVDVSADTDSATALPSLLEAMEGDIRGGSAVIEADELAALAEEQGVTVVEALRMLVEPARALARPPISNFNVGCVGLGASGRGYIGVNLEFAALPLNNSVHAEQFMMVNALHHGETQIDLLAISHAPCGHCRQFFCELGNSDHVRFIFGDSPNEGYGLADLLPLRFGPRDLIEDPAMPLLLQPRHNGLRLADSAEAAAESADVPGVARAIEAALKEANRSYAPYSECPAGLAMVTVTGEVYSGGYIESAAYNPSVAPLQAAFINAVSDGMPCYTRVTDVVLVELSDDPAVEHASTTATKLRKIAPDARLTVLKAVRD